MLFITFSNEKPTFYGYANSFEVYTCSASSNAIIHRVNATDYPFLLNKVGESIKINGAFSVTEFLEKFRAKIVFTEQTSDGISYYAYSSEIRYLKTIKGRRINLHLNVGKTCTTIGSPIIFGSF